jgi:Fe-S oxidoreductase
MVSAARMTESASVYFMRKLRSQKPDAIVSANECMMCMRCVEACPVGVNSCRLKQQYRAEINTAGPEDYSYLPAPSEKKTDLLYFAGCMGHLTPGVPQAMVKILKASGISFRFMDEDGSICCGRPLMLAGQNEAARKLMDNNKALIEQSGAQTLVTSCPICYRIFKEEYSLNIKILHHTEWINELLEKEIIHTLRKPLKVVYHDPCELGRGSGIYEAPRKALKQVVQLLPSSESREKALCCGGSIGSVTLDLKRRQKITRDAWNKLTENNPDLLVTACPLCQKTFSSLKGSKVRDISQIIAEAIDLN